MKKTILVLLILSIILLSGCSNSFKSCHERCMHIEKLKIDPNCEYTLSDARHVADNCNITWSEINVYREECFDKCVGGFSENE